MNAFNRLPGFVQTPAGRERDVLRLLPRALVFGTLLLALPSLGARIFFGFFGPALAFFVPKDCSPSAPGYCVSEWKPSHDGRR